MRQAWRGVRWVAMVAVLSCGAVSAQSVQRCVAPNGTVSYQDAPCAAGSRTSGSWDARPEPAPTPEQLRQRELQRQQARAESDFLSRRAGTDRLDRGSPRVARIPQDAGKARCDAARAQRERTLDMVGLKRTFDLLRKLDEQVREACR